MSLSLPPGITGFGAEMAPLTPQTSLKPFTALCYALVRRLHGRVMNVVSCEGKVTPNFHVAELHLRSGPVFLLCNAYYSWTAVVLEKPAFPMPVFAASTELQRTAQQYSEFCVMQPEDLNEPLSVSAVRNLSTFELGQLVYWKPERLGDVIFNFWD